jgi:hypothetical protein
MIVLLGITAEAPIGVPPVSVNVISDGMLISFGGRPIGVTLDVTFWSPPGEAQLVSKSNDKIKIRARLTTVIKHTSFLKLI